MYRTLCQYRLILHLCHRLDLHLPHQTLNYGRRPTPLPESLIPIFIPYRCGGTYIYLFKASLYCRALLSATDLPLKKHLRIVLMKNLPHHLDPTRHVRMLYVKWCVDNKCCMCVTDAALIVLTSTNVCSFGLGENATEDGRID